MGEVIWVREYGGGNMGEGIWGREYGGANMVEVIWGREKCGRKMGEGNGGGKMEEVRSKKGFQDWSIFHRA
jgi:hypothetical protein